MNERDFHRVASGEYQTADGRYRMYRIPGVNPPAWNVEDVSDPYSERVIVDGAASMRDAVSIFNDETSRA